jgi:outer membrane autotransporter protein
MAQMTNLQTRLVSLRSINEGRCFEAPARPSLAPPPSGTQKRTTVLGTELLEPPQPQPEQSFSMPLDNCRTLPDRATTLWSAGSLNVGAGEQAGASPFRFDSQGITLGGDIGVRPDLSFGAGIGVARDETVGLPAGGSFTGSNGNALTGYVSYRPLERVYVEAVVGVGDATMESTRIAAAGDEVAATRRGDQRFFSVSAGHRFGYAGWQVVPYTRVDHVLATLRSVNEPGGGSGALSFSDEKVPSLGWIAGYTAEASFVTSIGTIAPRTSLEYRRELERSDPGSLRYADNPTGPSYTLVPSAVERNSTTLGVGANLMMTSRWSFGLGGTLNRSTASSSTRVDATFSRVF